MTSTRFRMIGVVLLVVALSALEAYQWDGGPEDKAKIRACLGGTASIPWSIVTGSETILNTSWSFQAPDKEKTTIATYQSTHFYATDSVRFGFLANAGLSVRFARPQDSGNYSVRVQLQRAKSFEFVSAERTVSLSVTDSPPATQDGAFYVTLSDAVRDDVTQDWTLQLKCGEFVDLGQPPVDVVWETPTGEVRNSTYQDNGTFVLSVSSPVHLGNYYCQLPPSAPAARCLTATSPLNAAAELWVEDKDVIKSFCEARQRELEQVNKDQANLLQHRDNLLQHQDNLLQHQAKQISQQNGTIADMVRVNKDQANLLQHKDNLLQHQAMQISQQNGTIEELKADLLNVTTQLSTLTKTVKDQLGGRTASSCIDWLKLDPRSGIRTVYISGDPITVYCDQTTDNGGWIVFQRRQDNSVDFYRNWTDYRNGFGDPEKNFWLGLDKLHKLTTSQRYELRVDLHMWNGTKGHATFSGFYVDDLSHNFALHFDEFTGGNAGDSLSYHRGIQFTTKDRDNSPFGSYKCAQRFHGAWWYTFCHIAHLNGDYKNSSSAPGEDGLNWNTFGGSPSFSMKFTEMKIRPM